MGATTALVAGRLRPTAVRQHAPVLALLLFESVLGAPIGVALLALYPDWSVMYLAEARSWGRGAWLLVTAYPAAALAGYLSVRWLLRRQRQLWAAGVALAGAGGAALVVWGSMARLTAVGSTAGYRISPSGLEPLEQSQLAYLLAGAVSVLLLGWAALVWRIYLVRRAGVAAAQSSPAIPPPLGAGPKTQPPKHPADAPPPPPADPSADTAQPLEPTQPPRRQKAARGGSPAKKAASKKQPAKADAADGGNSAPKGGRGSKKSGGNSGRKGA